MADIKVDEFEYFHFFGMVKELISDLDNTNLSKQSQQRVETIKQYISDKELIRGLAKERNLYYSNYLEKKAENPTLANELYKIYLEKKEQINKISKKNNLVSNMINNMEEEHGQ